MKRHISIFTFLLGAFAVGFATEAVANQQSIFADGYWQPGKTELTSANDYLTPGIGYVYPPDSGNENQNVFTVGFKSGWTVDHWRQNTESFLFSDGTKIKGTDGLVTYTCPYSGTGNIYLAVKFKYIKYNVIYNAKGGSPTPESVLNQSYDAYFDLAAAPTKTGYTFKSWKASSNGKTFTAGASVRGSTLGLGDCHVDGSNVTMTAVYTANVYKVTFNRNGGGSPDPTSKTVTYGKTYGDLATCSRAGYTFAGWYTGKTSGNKIESDTKVAITANQTLYAHWTANTYTVTIDPNGGSGGQDTTYTVSESEQTRAITKPTRTGYSITGWTVSGATGTTPTVSGTTLTIPANVYGNLTLKPSWTPITYTITYTGNKAAHSNPSTYTIESETIVFTPPDGVVGFKFNGWSPASIAKGSTGNKTVTANYLTKVDPPVAKTPLTYNGSGQSCASSTEQYQATDNQQTVPGQYTATFTLCPGYCWSDGSVTNRTAKWEILNASLSDVSVKQSGSLVYTGKPQTPTVFHQATTVGQKTVTWTYSASGSDFSPAVPSFTEIGEHKVYYRAEAEYHKTAEGSFIVTIEDSRYTIEFDGGAGAEGSMEPVSLIHDEPYVVENAFTKKGCEFVTWRTVIGGVATNFDVGATVSNLSAEAGTVITFTADWLGRYTVAFDGNGGEGTMTNVTYEEDREYRLPSNAFTRSGYHFTGWATNGTEVVFTDGAAVSNLAAPGETCTLKAQWKEITLGEAMHCNDLSLEWGLISGTSGAATNDWISFVGAGVGDGTDSCVRQTGFVKKSSEQKWLVAQVSTNGCLSFAWKPTGCNGQLTFWFGNEADSSGGSRTNLTGTAESWSTFNMSDIPAGSWIHLYFNSTGGICDIDQMTWVPEGSEPKQGDPVAATAAGIEDGVFSLTIPTVSGIEYGVWTNADLTVPAENWGLMGETQKAKGDSLKFEWTILPGFPQLFFRAYKVDYK